MHYKNLVAKVEAGVDGGKVVNNGNVAVFACRMETRLSTLTKKSKTCHAHKTKAIKINTFDIKLPCLSLIFLMHLPCFAG